jgi:hypothetical protein
MASSIGQRPRWVGVGTSTDGDSTRAGADSAKAALRGDDPRLLVVFASDRHDLKALLAGVNETSGGVPLIGCSTAGEIWTDGPEDASVVVTALGGDGFSVSTAFAQGVSDDQRGAGAAVAAAVADLDDRPHQVLLLLTDGLAGSQEEVVRGAYTVLGASVPLVGGCAGDDLKMRQTFQFHNDQVLSNAAVGAALGSDAPFGIGVQHGWRKVGEPMIVTNSAHSRVYTLDDEPALDVYLRRLNAPPEAQTDPSAFTRFALTHPLGLRRRIGEEMRFVQDADFSDRSLGCIADVPRGGLTWIMEGDEESVLRATENSCMDALASLNGLSPLGLIAFDCVARRGVLGNDGIRSEIQRVARQAGGAPVAGFYTYGEIARTRGTGGFHNQTLVVLAMG